MNHYEPPPVNPLLAWQMAELKDRQDEQIYVQRQILRQQRISNMLAQGMDMPAINRIFAAENEAARVAEAASNDESLKSCLGLGALGAAVIWYIMWIGTFVGAVEPKGNPWGVIPSSLAILGPPWLFYWARTRHQRAQRKQAAAPAPAAQAAAAKAAVVQAAVLQAPAKLSDQYNEGTCVDCHKYVQQDARGLHQRYCSEKQVPAAANGDTHLERRYYVHDQARDGSTSTGARYLIIDRTTKQAVGQAATIFEAWAVLHEAQQQGGASG